MRHTAVTLAALALLCGPAPAARADFILDPASASTNAAIVVASPSHAINQSGLSAPYTSGVTDFAAYIASNPTHNSGPAANSFAGHNNSLGFTPFNLDFNLGGTFTLDAFALWNFGSNAFVNVVGFDLLASADSSFSSTTLLGSFNANPNTGFGSAVLPEVFTFTPTSAAFVRMRITSNNGFSSTIFGEAAFSVQAAATSVPEPSTFALLGLGALALVGYARRRKAA